MNNINKNLKTQYIEKIKNLNKNNKILIIFFLFFIVFLTFIFIPQKTQKIISPNNNNSSNNDLVPEQESSQEEGSLKEDILNQETIKDSKTENDKTKFNLSLKNGNTALVNKDYLKAKEFYAEALSYFDSDVVYARLFSLYSAQSDWNNALSSIENAIRLNPVYTDYYVSKITLLDDKFSYSFLSLKNIYTEALSKADPKNKVNLVTFFAKISEKRGEQSYAISLWEHAKELNPSMGDIYQKEIDRLK